MDSPEEVDIFLFVCRENRPGRTPFAFKIPLCSLVFDLIVKVAHASTEKVYAENICIWKPNSFLGPADHPKLVSWMREHKNDFNQFCTNLSHCEEVFFVSDILSIQPQGGRATKGTCLIAQVREPIKINTSDTPSPLKQGEEDRIAQMHKTFMKNITYLAGGSPSANCNPYRYLECQESERMCILDGRYAEEQNPIPPPIEIFHPVFAAFVAESRDPNLEVPEFFVQQIPELMRVVSKIGTEEEPRYPTTRGLLKNLLKFPIDMPWAFENHCVPYYGALYMRCRGDPIGMAALAIVEEEAELGSGNDVAVKGSFSYREHWAQQGQRKLTKACFAPSFVVSLAGPHLCICGAVFTTSPIVQRLTDYIWLAQSRHIDDARALHIARVLWALSRALRRLEEYYAKLSTPADPKARFFPLATRFTEGGGQTVEFDYVDVLGFGPPEASVVFRARERTGARRELVVKFAERYGEAAHRLLADAGLAPALLYCGDVWQSGPERDGCGSVRMVVMEYVEGRSAPEVFGNEGLPADVLAEVRRAVELMHSHVPPLVHGDVRKPNMVIADSVVDGDTDFAGRVKIVDFDWAGVQGDARYPLNLSSNIRWAEGVRDHALIMVDHDKEMVERLVPRSDVELLKAYIN